MAKISEETFSTWTGRASDAEQQRYERTRDAIIEAIKASDAWQDADLVTYAKGSYPNFTNVVRDSDVDIAVEMRTAMFNDFFHAAANLTKADVGLTSYSGTYNWQNLKNDIEEALVNAFGRAAVKRGNKALHLHEAARGFAADVVPCYQYRAYVTAAGGYRTGIQIHADDGTRIINYPKQHLDEGVIKNDATQRRYKRVVRILKRLENQMKDEGVIQEVPSFLIESLVWNVENVTFAATTWTERVRLVLGALYAELNDAAKMNEMREANSCKYLFRLQQKWTNQEAMNFVLLSWAYLEF